MYENIVLKITNVLKYKKIKNSKFLNIGTVKSITLSQVEYSLKFISIS